MLISPEVLSLFDADGELVGEVHQRFGRVATPCPGTGNLALNRWQLKRGTEGNFARRSMHSADLEL